MNPRRALAISFMTCIAGLALSPRATADVSLPSIFGDHMVLQRDTGVPVWGTAEAGERVTVQLSSEAGGKVTADATADEQGQWRVELPISGEPGPFTLSITGSGTEAPIEFRDVLVGEVWLCSGQSNMEWSVAASANASQEIAAAKYPQMRIFHVARATAGEPADDVRGEWQVVTPETIPNFSAVGYYFGRHVHRETGVPVGLIGSSWGGTPIMAWMAPDALEASGFGDALTEARDRIQLLSEAPAPGPIRDEGIAHADWAAGDNAFRGWGTTRLPGRISAGGLEIDGALWYARHVDVPEAWAGKPLTLRMGQIDDDDVTWFNGAEVGRTLGWTKQREYRIPGELVKAGRNTITVRVFDAFGPGGFLGERGDLTLSAEGEGKPIDLAGDWQVAAERVVVRSPDEMARIGAGAASSTPTMLYNGMIAPVAPYAVRGFLWYQGESDAWQAQNYAALLRGMIADWRARFEGPDARGPQPFLIVQLANFQQRSQDPAGNDEWARLRAAQSEVAGEPGNGIAITIDIGDAGDIHPRNKQEVGRRLALVALRDVYDLDVEASGPTLRSAAVREGQVVLSFDHAQGLALNGEASHAFAVGDAAGNFAWAEAKVEGDKVILTAPGIGTPTVVRYAWQINPPSPLVNDAGLPAGPFEAKLE